MILARRAVAWWRRRTWICARKLPRAASARIHTGGASGAPKLARHTHAKQLHAASGAASMYGARPQCVILNGFPLFDVAGSFVCGLSILLGGEVVLSTRIGLRNGAFMGCFGDFVDGFCVTLPASVPTVIAGLLALASLGRQMAGLCRAEVIALTWRSRLGPPPGHSQSSGWR